MISVEEVKYLHIQHVSGSVKDKKIFLKLFMEM